MTLKTFGILDGRMEWTGTIVEILVWLGRSLLLPLPAPFCPHLQLEHSLSWYQEELVLLLFLLSCTLCENEFQKALLTDRK